MMILCLGGINTVDLFNLKCKECWRAEGKAEKVVCPHCHAKLQVDDSRQRNFDFKNYFMIITKRGEYQVLRMFYIHAKMRKGMPCDYWMTEVFQRWMNANEHSEIVGRKRNSHPDRPPQTQRLHGRLSRHLPESLVYRHPDRQPHGDAHQSQHLVFLGIGQLVITVIENMAALKYNVFCEAEYRKLMQGDFS